MKHKLKMKRKLRPKRSSKPKRNGLKRADLYFGIAELLTLESADKKGGRRVSESDLSEIKRAAMVVADGNILYSGVESKLSSKAIKALGYEIQRETRLDRGSVIPAFAESHTHLIFAGNRENEFEKRNQGATYQEIAAAGGGIRSTVVATEKCSSARLLDLAQARADQFVAQGVTTLEVKSGYGLSARNEIRLLEVAQEIRGPEIVATHLGLHSVSKDQPLEDQIRDQIAAMKVVARRRLAERVDIFVERGFFDLKHLEIWAEEALRNQLKLVAHVDQLSAGGGAAKAASLQALSVDHAVHLNDKEIQELARSETTAVLLPAADFYMKVDYPRARAMIETGVRVALATDFNPGTSPTQDLSLIGVLARLEMKMTLPEVMAAYTVGAAWALGRQNRLGALVPNKSADFVCLDGSWRELFYRVGHHPVAEVYRQGRKICQNLSRSTKKSFAKA